VYWGTTYKSNPVRGGGIEGFYQGVRLGLRGSGVWLRPIAGRLVGQTRSSRGRRRSIEISKDLTNFGRGCLGTTQKVTSEGHQEWISK
jgi:hypothetical protein